MNLKLLGLAAATAFSLSSGAALAVTYIDDFSDDQLVTDAPAGALSNTDTATGLSGVIGGSRTITATNTTPTTGITDTTLNVTGGELLYSNDAGAEGSATLYYDGNGAGLGDLLAGPSGGYFFFELSTTILFDSVVNVTVTAEDTFGNSATYVELVDPSFDPFLSFDEFAGVDFNSIASLTFTVDSTGLGGGADGALASIQYGSIPLPASGLLLVGGLAGIGAIRRRRSKDA